MQSHAPSHSPHERLATGLGWFGVALGTAELAAPRALARLLGIPDDPRLVSVLRGFGARQVASGLGILAQPSRAGWMWSRVGGDAIDLAFLSSAANEDSADQRRVALAAAAVAAVTALDVVCAKGLQAQTRAGADGGMPPGDVSADRVATTTNKPIGEV